MIKLDSKIILYLHLLLVSQPTFASYKNYTLQMPFAGPENHLPSPKTVLL